MCNWFSGSFFFFCFFLFPPFYLFTFLMVLFKKKGWHHLPSLQPPTHWKSTQLTITINENTFFPSTITTHPFFKHPFQPTRFFSEILCLEKESLKLTNLRTEPNEQKSVFRPRIRPWVFKGMIEVLSAGTSEVDGVYLPDFTGVF